MFEEDPNGVIEEKYAATEEEMAIAIQDELSDYVREVETLLDKVRSLNPKILGVTVEKPDSLFLELKL